MLSQITSLLGLGPRLPGGPAATSETTGDTFADVFSGLEKVGEVATGGKDHKAESDLTSSEDADVSPENTTADGAIDDPEGIESEVTRHDGFDLDTAFDDDGADDHGAIDHGAIDAPRAGVEKQDHVAAAVVAVASHSGGASQATPKTSVEGAESAKDVGRGQVLERPVFRSVAGIPARSQAFAPEQTGLPPKGGQAVMAREAMPTKASSSSDIAAPTLVDAGVSAGVDTVAADAVANAALRTSGSEFSERGGDTQIPSQAIPRVAGLSGTRTTEMSPERPALQTGLATSAAIDVPPARPDVPEVATGAFGQARLGTGTEQITGKALGQRSGAVTPSVRMPIFEALQSGSSPFARHGTIAQGGTVPQDVPSSLGDGSGQGISVLSQRGGTVASALGQPMQEAARFMQDQAFGSTVSPTTSTETGGSENIGVGLPQGVQRILTGTQMPSAVSGQAGVSGGEAVNVNPTSTPALPLPRNPVVTPLETPMKVEVRTLGTLAVASATGDTTRTDPIAERPEGTRADTTISDPRMFSFVSRRHSPERASPVPSTATASVTAVASEPAGKTVSGPGLAVGQAAGGQLSTPPEEPVVGDDAAVMVDEVESSFGAAIQSRSAQTGGSTPVHLQSPPQGRPEPSAVLRQIAEGAARASDGTVELRLSPDELGRVRMFLTSGEHGLTVQILADRPETLDLMRRNVNELAQQLADAGFEGAGFSFGEDRQQDGTAADLPDRIASAEPETEDVTIGAAQAVTTDGVDIRI